MSDSALGCGCLSIVTLVILAIVGGLIGGPSWVYIIVTVALLTLYIHGYRNGAFDQTNAQANAQASQANTQTGAQVSQDNAQAGQRHAAQQEVEAAELERLLAIEQQSREKTLSAALRHSGLMEEIGHLSGTEFEAFVAEFLEAQGYAVQTTLASGDQGVDLVASVPDGGSSIVSVLG